MDLFDFGADSDPDDGVQCTGVTDDGYRCPRIVEYTTDRLLCPSCKRSADSEAD